MTIRIEQGISVIQLEVKDMSEAVDIFEHIMPHCKLETTLSVTFSADDKREGEE